MSHRRTIMWTCICQSDRGPRHGHSTHQHRAWAATAIVSHERLFDMDVFIVEYNMFHLRTKDSCSCVFWNCSTTVPESARLYRVLLVYAVMSID